MAVVTHQRKQRESPACYSQYTLVHPSGVTSPVIPLLLRLEVAATSTSLFHYLAVMP